MKYTLRSLAIAIPTLLLSLSTLTSCGVAKDSNRETLYPKLYEEKPTSIVVMPPINETNQVEAKDNFFATLMVPLAERGYYVYSPFLAKELLEQESAANAEVFLEGDLRPFGRVFGADAVLFTIIHRWEKQALTSSINIDAEYILRSVRTGENIFARRIEGTLDTSVAAGAGGGIFGVLVSLAADALSTALTDKGIVAQLANEEAVSDMPVGKYHNSYDKDRKTPASPAHVRGVVLRRK